MLHSDGVKVADFFPKSVKAAYPEATIILTSAAHEHLITGQSFLECRTHEGITSSWLHENGKVYIEEREVDNERNKNKTNSTSNEMLPEIILYTASASPVRWAEETTHHRCPFPVVQNIPKINQDSTSDADHSQDTVDFGTPSACHEDTSENQPDPPFRRKFANTCHISRVTNRQPPW